MSAPREGSEKGIVVLGTPRSGTTLLRRLLNAHPDIVCPGETGVLGGCARFLREDEIAEGLRVGVLAGLGHAGFARDVVLDRLRSFAFSFHEELAKSAGRRRWAEKTAFDSFYVDEIAELCGNQVQFICMIRNGLDVVCSLQDLSVKNQGYLPELHEYVRRHPNVYEAFAHCWTDLTRKILAFVERAGGRAVLVRYEDLVLRPDETLPVLFEFVGERLPADLIETALSSGEDLGLGDWKTYGKRKLDASSIGRGMALGRRTRSALGEIMNPMLTRCGYEIIPEVAEEDEATRRRRYELALLAQRLLDDGEE